MELQRAHYLGRLLFVLRYLAADAVTFNFNCDFSGQYSGLLQLGQYFPLDVILGHPLNASFRIISKCCDDVIVGKASCSGCAGTGSNMCHTNSDFVSFDYTKSAPLSCRNSTKFSVSCLSIKCEARKEFQVRNTAFADPGYVTGCLHDGKYYTCTGNGTWVAEICTNSTLHTTDTNARSSMPPMSATYYWNTSTENQTDTHVHYALGTTEGLTIGNGTLNETMSAMLEKKKAMKEFYMFLIAFGAILVFVSALVCGFFIRNRKKRPFDRDCPLEYWRDQDYVDGVMNKAYHSKSPFSVNPIYASDKSGSIDNSYHGHMEDKTQKSRERLERNSSHRSNRSEFPRVVKRDSSNKYLTTATGSNFYSYRKSPDIDVTDIDFALEGCSDYGERSPSIPRGTKIYPSSSFKPHRSGKKLRKPSENGLHDENNAETRDKVNELERNNSEIYAVSYKYKTKHRLNNWSAEESDV